MGGVPNESWEGFVLVGEPESMRGGGAGVSGGSWRGMQGTSESGGNESSGGTPGCVPGNISGSSSSDSCDECGSGVSGIGTFRH